MAAKTKKATKKTTAKKPAAKTATKKMTSATGAKTKSSKKKVLKKDLPPKAKKVIEDMKTDELADMSGFECDPEQDTKMN